MVSCFNADLFYFLHDWRCMPHLISWPFFDSSKQIEKPRLFSIPLFLSFLLSYFLTLSDAYPTSNLLSTNVWFVWKILIYLEGLDLQEAQKLLQPSDKVLKTMALELAEFQVFCTALYWCLSLLDGIHFTHACELYWLLASHFTNLRSLIFWTFYPWCVSCVQRDLQYSVVKSMDSVIGRCVWTYF